MADPISSVAVQPAATKPVAPVEVKKPEETTGAVAAAPAPATEAVAKKEEKDTRILENQIDNWIYKLYELTYEEVKIVEPNFKLSKTEYEKLKVGK